MTPEEKLCSRLWRLGHSAWLLFSILSFGLLTGAGFLLIGLKARNRYWLISAAGWGAVLVIYIIAVGQIDTGTKANPVRSFAGDMLVLGMLLTWVGGMIHSFTARRSWLRWRAQKGATAWYANPATTQVDRATAELDTSVLDRALRDQGTARAGAAAAWVEPPPVPQAAALQQIDLNSGSQSELKLVLGLDDAWADWIIGTRVRLGGFSSVDQLMTEAQMPPHMFLPMRGKIVPPSPAPGLAPKAATGRQLDI